MKWSVLQSFPLFSVRSALVLERYLVVYAKKVVFYLTFSPYLTLFPFLCASQWRSSWRTIILWEEPGYRAASKPRRWSSTGARAMVPTARSTASMAGDSLWRWAPTNLSPTSVPYLNNPAPQTHNSGILALFCRLYYFLQLHSYLGLSS